jgi:transposase
MPRIASSDASSFCRLKRFYEQVKARRGAGKAIIALARKFLGIIYRTLKKRWVFEDFPNFVLAEKS